MARTLLDDIPSLTGMVYNPNEQFDRIEDRPVFLGGLFITALVIAIGMWLSLTNFDVSAVANMDQLVDFNAEELSAFEVISKLTYIFVGLFGPLIQIVMASLLFLVVARTFHSEATYKQLFSLNTYVLFIFALGVFVNGLITFWTGADPETVFTSLGVLFKADGLTGAILENIEIFRVWALVLTAIGLQKVAHVPKNVAWIITVVFYIFTIIVMVSTPMA